MPNSKAFLIHLQKGAEMPVEGEGSLVSYGLYVVLFSR